MRDIVPCGAPIEGASGKYMICNMVAYHIGPHQHLGEIRVPCGLLITWYGTGSDTCTLRAGHRGLHSSGPGDYIGGRTTEDVLVEAFQRISDLEARIRELEPGTDTRVTEASVDRAMGVLERRITDRLSGIESLIRDVGAKVSQQCGDSESSVSAPAGGPLRKICGAVRPFNGVDHVCERNPGHVGLHRDAAENVNASLLWDAQGARPDPFA